MYRIPRIDDVFPANAAAYDGPALERRVRDAFLSLPQHAVDDISVSAPATFDPATETKLDIIVDFTGTSTSGDQQLLQCFLGCEHAGCRPRHR